MAQTPLPSQSDVVTASRAHHIATTNLLSIFSNRNESTRLTAIKDIFAPDAIVYEPNHVVLRSHNEISKTVSKLLAEREGWGFVKVGEVKYNSDFVGVRWGFGPEGPDGVDVKATGEDVILVGKGEDGVVRIKVLYVVLDGVADAKA